MQPSPQTTLDYIELIQQERKDSAKERKDLQRNFLDAIKTQTEHQNISMKTLGDRLERQLESMRSDIRNSTNRIFYTFIVAFLVLAALAGVAIKFKSLELTPTAYGSTNSDSKESTPIDH